MPEHLIDHKGRQIVSRPTFTREHQQRVRTAHDEAKNHHDSWVGESSQNERMVNLEKILKEENPFQSKEELDRFEELVMSSLDHHADPDHKALAQTWFSNHRSANPNLSMDLGALMRHEFVTPEELDFERELEQKSSPITPSSSSSRPTAASSNTEEDKMSSEEFDELLLYGIENHPDAKEVGLKPEHAGLLHPDIKAELVAFAESKKKKK